MQQLWFEGTPETMSFTKKTFHKILKKTLVSNLKLDQLCAVEKVIGVHI